MYEYEYITYQSCISQKEKRLYPETARSDLIPIKEINGRDKNIMLYGRLKLILLLCIKVMMKNNQNYHT